VVQQEHDEGLVKDDQTGVGLEKEELEAIRKELAEVKAKADVNLAGWQRAQADFVNYKRRSEQERLETINFANSVLVSSLLPILDDFERAFNCLPPELDGAAWVEGIRLIERKLRTTLEADGLLAIKAVGEPFDPRLHEAVRQAKGKEGIVVEEVQKGYKFRDRVIRPSKVIVGNGEEEGGGAGQGNTSV
jgi:molecular chaperone GrpE